MRSPVITEVKAGKFWRRIACWASRGGHLWREVSSAKLASGYIVQHTCEFCEAEGEETRAPRDRRRVAAFLKAVQARNGA